MRLLELFLRLNPFIIPSGAIIGGIFGIIFDNILGSLFGFIISIIITLIGIYFLYAEPTNQLTDEAV